MGYVIMKIRRGDTHEYEDSRVTHRLQATRALLESQGIDFTPRYQGEPMIGHEDTCERAPRKLANIGFGYRERVICNCHVRDAKPELPEWLTDEHIHAAYNLACEMIESRATMHHRAIAEKRMAR